MCTADILKGCLGQVRKLFILSCFRKILLSSSLSVELDMGNKKPSYMALKQDECNATVEVTEKTGLEVVNTESFDVNVCLKEIYKVIN